MKRQAAAGEPAPERATEEPIATAVEGEPQAAPESSPPASEQGEERRDEAAEASVEGAGADTKPPASVDENPPAPEEPMPTPVAKLEDLKAVLARVEGDFRPAAYPDANPSDGPSLATVLGGLPLPVIVHAGDTLHFANREFFRLTGYESLEEIAAAGGLEALFVEGAEPAANAAAMRLRRADGDEIDVGGHLQSVAWQGGKALLLALRPAAETAAEPGSSDNEDELRNRLEELRAIVDTATDGVVLIDEDGLIRSISRPAEALFGMDSRQVEGNSFTTLFAIESQRAASDYLAGLADNGVASVLNDGREVIGREAQGRFIPLFMTIGRLPAGGGYCAVLRDITQWKRAEEELTQARAQAERASSQKTEFLARVSHEVRTPLNAIIGFSELMLDEKFGPIGNERYRDYLRDINRSGNHVLDLVNDLLDISKIEAGEQEMSYEAVSLNDSLSETVAMMQPQANRERVIIRSSFASRLPDVVADQRSVRQIALNLLSNAVRATPPGGQVIVSTAYEQSGDIVIRVRDTGIGMTIAEIEQALKPFKQINALKRARGDGTGLGLPLTKALVEANRARFQISSSPGQGTMVEITFPSTRVLAD
jgi:PAS domain S-box-containing protein